MSNKELPVFLTKEEQDKILAIPNSNYPTGERNRSIIKLMLDTGLKSQELVNLKWHDIDFIVNAIIVREDKKRKIPINQETIYFLKGWQKTQIEELRSREVDKDIEYVFTTLKGNKISTSYLRQMIYRVKDKTDIKKSISPSTLRHTFAVNLYKKTKDIEKVQKQLGYDNISNAAIYVEIVNNLENDKVSDEALWVFKNLH